MDKKKQECGLNCVEEGVEVMATVGPGEEGGEVMAAVDSGEEGGEVMAIADPGDEGGELVDSAVDSEHLFSEAMSRLPRQFVPIDARPCDISDDQAVALFLSNGCTCSKWRGKPCSGQFSFDYVQQVRVSFMDLEKHLMLMGELIACSNCLPQTSADMRNTSHERKKAYTSFTHQGKPICQKMFLMLHLGGNI